MDIFSKSKRSDVMSRIRSVDTKAEVRLRKALFARGYRYRKNVRALPGAPDIVLSKYKYIIQVRGCFWHAHGCSRSHTPSTNQGYWLPKLARNVERDKISSKALRALGWRVRIVWECKISSHELLSETVNRIDEDLTGQPSRPARAKRKLPRGTPARLRGGRSKKRSLTNSVLHEEAAHRRKGSLS